MLCPSCNNFRPATTAPCPSCHASSPLVNDGWGGSDASFGNAWNNQNQAGSGNGWNNQDQANFGNAWGNQNQVGSGNAWNNQDQANFGNAWGNQDQTGFANSGISPIGGTANWQNPSGQLSFSQNFQQDPTTSGVQQLSFPAGAPQQNADNAFWSQQGRQMDPALLPGPYQGQQEPGSQALMVMPTGFPTPGSGIQPVNGLLPALPGTHQEAAVYVAPMYTTPRPLIPRYRAISGLLSIIIVVGLLCSAAGYFAQTSGKLIPLEKMLGVYTPPQITLAQQALPPPSSKVVFGPAISVIYSAAIGTKVDSTTGEVPYPVNQFEVQNQIFVSCSVNTKGAGQVAVWWYTNGTRYIQDDRPIAVNTPMPVTLAFNRPYVSPAEGKVEIYWQPLLGKDKAGNPQYGPVQPDQLAATMLFVVDPVA